MSGSGRVLLFSGHMVDRPGRAKPRFPAEMEGVVALCTLDLLGRLEAGAGDLGMCGGAAGGDLIFAEACLGQGVALELCLPQPEDEFLDASVAPSGTGWRERYLHVAASAVRVEVMPADYLVGRGTGDGSEGEGLGLYARHGRWMLERALAHGADRLTVVALWDGRPGDGSGGTADVIAAAREHTDRVHVIWPG